jgi:hypothetical protein
MYTAMPMEKSKSTGEQIWMVSILWGGCLPTNTSGTDRYSIKNLQVVNKSIIWMPVDFDDNANQHKKSVWDPGGCMLALLSYEKWWTS